MYGIVKSNTPTQFGQHLKVQSVEDLTFLIKESEVFKGTSGRKFFMVLNDGFVLNTTITWDGSMFLVTNQHTTQTQAVSEREMHADLLLNHDLGRSLFTEVF